MTWVTRPFFSAAVIMSDSEQSRSVGAVAMVRSSFTTSNPCSSGPGSSGGGRRGRAASAIASSLVIWPNSGDGTIGPCAPSTARRSSQLLDRRAAGRRPAAGTVSGIVGLPAGSHLARSAVHPAAPPTSLAITQNIGRIGNGVRGYPSSGNRIHSASVRRPGPGPSCRPCRTPSPAGSPRPGRPRPGR